MKFSYFGGAPGVLVSGIVWILSGVVAILGSNQTSMLVLFFGGMLIHPLSILLAKSLGRTGKHASENPLGMLALESTGLLFIGLFIAFTIAKVEADWFYPVMLLTIGGRYLVFSTLYGDRLYWYLGGLLALSGVLCIQLNAPFFVGAFIGGFLEVIFSVFLALRLKGSE